MKISKSLFDHCAFPIITFVLFRRFLIASRLFRYKLDNYAFLILFNDWYLNFYWYINHLFIGS